MCVLAVAYVNENYFGLMSALYVLTRGVIAWVTHLSKVIMDFTEYKFHLIKIVLKFCAFLDICAFLNIYIMLQYKHFRENLR